MDNVDVSGWAVCCVPYGSVGIGCVLFVSGGIGCVLFVSAGIGCILFVSTGISCILFVSEGIGCILFLSSGISCILFILADICCCLLLLSAGFFSFIFFAFCIHFCCQLSEAEIEVVLDKTMMLFRFLQDKVKLSSGISLHGIAVFFCTHILLLLHVFLLLTIG